MYFLRQLVKTTIVEQLKHMRTASTTTDTTENITTGSTTSNNISNNNIEVMTTQIGK